MASKSASRHAVSSSVTRREFVKTLGLGATGIPVANVAGAGSASGQAGERAGRPNVLFIMTDQQRYDSLGCYGNSCGATPNVDELARTGARFDNTFVAQPLCAPARSSILTGLFPHRTGVVDNGMPLMDHSTSFPNLLHQAGYRTGYIGKWHLGPQGNGPLVQPSPLYFDVWEGYQTEVSHWIGPCGKYAPVMECLPPVAAFNSDEIPDFGGASPGTYRSDMETDAAIEFMQKHHGGPFCLFMSYYPPHGFWTAPEENCLRFKGRVKYPTYYAMVNRIDENVGRLVASLRGLGIRENTIIVYTSDHGYNFVHRWNQHEKRVCYDTASRIPLIFNWTNHISSRAVSRLVSQVDLAPTILELCGVPIPDGVHGQSVKPLLEGIERPWRDALVIQNRPYDDIGNGMFERCIVTERWKLILNSLRGLYDSGGRIPELYDRHEKAEDLAHNLLSMIRVFKRQTSHDCAETVIQGGYSDDPAVQQVRKELFEKLKTWAWQIGDSQAISLLHTWAD